MLREDRCFIKRKVPTESKNQRVPKVVYRCGIWDIIKSQHYRRSSKRKLSSTGPGSTNGRPYCLLGVVI